MTAAVPCPKPDALQDFVLGHAPETEATAQASDRVDKNAEKQGEQRNIRQNTTHQVTQQDR